jgi:hypothetical protein
MVAAARLLELLLAPRLLRLEETPMEVHRPRTSTPNRIAASGSETDVDWIEHDEPGREEEPDLAPLAVAMNPAAKDRRGLGASRKSSAWRVISEADDGALRRNENGTSIVMRCIWIDIHLPVHHRK